MIKDTLGMLQGVGQEGLMEPVSFEHSDTHKHRGNNQNFQTRGGKISARDQVGLAPRGGKDRNTREQAGFLPGEMKIVPKHMQGNSSRAGSNYPTRSRKIQKMLTMGGGGSAAPEHDSHGP